MVETTKHEREIKAATSYVSCFTGTDLRRTIIVIGCNCIQVLSGNPLRAYATYFFQQAGLPTSQAFNMNIVSYVLGMIGVLVAVSFYSSLWIFHPLLTSWLVGSPTLYWPPHAVLVRSQLHVRDIPIHRWYWYPACCWAERVVIVGRWRPSSCLVPHQQHHSQPGRVCLDIGDSILFATKQISCHRPQLLFSTHNGGASDYALSTQLVSLELGRKDSVLLGWDIIYLTGVYVSLHPGA